MNETILDELETVIHHGVMDNIQRGKPDTLNKIVLGVEA